MLHRLCGPPSIPLSFSLAALLPTLSRLSVSNGPAERLRHWYSSRYLRIPPLHREFHLPLPCSSPTVLPAAPELSPGISPATYRATYAPFTPSDSGQRSHPPYYRGCWHGVSRCFLWRYRHPRAPIRSRVFVPPDSGLQPEGRHPTRGVAASALRPLRNIPHCCLP